MASQVISDGWAAYSGLQALGFNHSVVNHSENFVSPNDPMVHTQNIENLWRCLRRFLNSRSSYSRDHLTTYLWEFTFRKCFPNTFETMISAIEAQYCT
jgi:transposase-like protein